MEWHGLHASRAALEEDGEGVVTLLASLRGLVPKQLLDLGVGQLDVRDHAGVLADCASRGCGRRSSRVHLRLGGVVDLGAKGLAE